MELFSKVQEIFLDYIIVDSDAFKMYKVLQTIVRIVFSYSISNEDLNCYESSRESVFQFKQYYFFIWQAFQTTICFKFQI